MKFEKAEAEAEELSFRERQRNNVKARWAKKTPEERSAYGKMMVAAREAKRKSDRAASARHKATYGVAVLPPEAALLPAKSI